jgi:tetratricopeptide (TPR) repeat protein
LLASALGYAYALAGQVAAGISLLEQAVQQSKALNIFFRYALWLSWLGEAYLLADRTDDAREATEQAIERTKASKEPGHRAYALRLLAEITRHHNPPEIKSAKTYYQQALTLATALGMRPLQAHCHRGLGTLYRQTGQAAQARVELSTAIAMYREMEMTFWLPETEAALAAVEGKA